MFSDEREKDLKLFLKEQRLKCSNLVLLDMALTHSSYINENRLEADSDYERLEFLGDAVLKLIISDYLFNIFPEYDEGRLSKIRSIIVSDTVLASFARKIGLQDYIQVGPAEEKQGGRLRESTLACAFEAVLGALYLDGRLENLYSFLIDLASREVEFIDKNDVFYNPKAILQEFTQEKYKILPIYETVLESGPAHDKTFVVQVMVKDQKVGQGQGKTKKEAQQKAAYDAIEKLGLIKDE
ncbi:MAG: ribonuclease III [Candidatus Gastranaerophilales bacterium]|nr:ribonuclease III [Candidatus Gastranaerophilales bacterium]